MNESFQFIKTSRLTYSPLMNKQKTIFKSSVKHHSSNLIYSCLFHFEFKVGRGPSLPCCAKTVSGVNCTTLQVGSRLFLILNAKNNNTSTQKTGNMYHLNHTVFLCAQNMFKNVCNSLSPNHNPVKRKDSFPYGHNYNCLPFCVTLVE